MKTPNPSPPAASPARSARTIAIITGLKPGDPAQLATQPMALVSIAYELGRADRKTYLAEVAKTIKTVQPIGQLFSFHKKALIEGGFIGFEKILRTQWAAECAARAAKGAAAV
jgi:hypothetical protein